MMWPPGSRSANHGSTLLEARPQLSRLAFSADGAYVVAVDTQSSALKLYEVKTGRPVGNPMIGHTGFMLNVEFTADGKHIVSRRDGRWVDVVARSRQLARRTLRQTYC